MSKFSGPQGRGALRIYRAKKRSEAQARQGHAIGWGRGVPCPEHNNRIHSR